MKLQHRKDKKKVLKITSLGGVGNVTKNLFVYEYGNDIIVVDCGIGFPSGEMPGVDIIIPDVHYLLEREEKIRGFIITHGHEDHFGALPYVLPQFKRNIPVFATELVSGFISVKLQSFGQEKTYLKIVDPDKGPFRLGVFNITPFRVNHSVPDSVGYIIKTPQGTIVHVSDFKFDWTPVSDKPFEVARLTKNISGGVRVLLSDCLGSLVEGYTRTEKDIEKIFDSLLDSALGQVFVTTISSNISRMQQAINASVRHNRKVALLGYSVNKNVRVAEKLGYLKIPRGTLIKPEKAASYPSHAVTYIIAGSYGQKSSALFRLASGKHRFAKLKQGATVIFSADPSPPGVKDDVDVVVGKLTELGADVHHYEIQENLHISGHGVQGDLMMLVSIVEPLYVVPIGGAPSMMRGYKKLVKKCGVASKNVLELKEGQTINISESGVFLGKVVKTYDVLVDGLGVGVVGSIILRDRRTLAQSGLLLVVIPLDKSTKEIRGEIQVISKGFVFEKAAQDILDEVKKITYKVVGTSIKNKKVDNIKSCLKKELRRFLFREIEKRPIILPIIVRV